MNEITIQLNDQELAEAKAVVAWAYDCVPNADLSWLAALALRLHCDKQLELIETNLGKFCREPRTPASVFADQLHRRPGCRN